MKRTKGQSIMFKCTIKKQNMGMWNGFVWLGVRSNVHGKETSGLMKDEGVTDQLSDCQFYNKDVNDSYKT